MFIIKDIATKFSMKKLLIAGIIIAIVIGVTASVFFGMAFLFISFLTGETPVPSDGRPDKPFYVEEERFENVKTIKSKECLDLVEQINTMNPGAQRVELYELWLDECIVPDPEVPSLP